MRRIGQLKPGLAHFVCQLTQTGKLTSSLLAMNSCGMLYLSILAAGVHVQVPYASRIPTRITYSAGSAPASECERCVCRHVRHDAASGTSVLPEGAADKQVPGGLLHYLGGSGQGTV